MPYFFKKDKMVYRRKALSLVELMIAVSILAIGIVFVLRSFLAVVSALGSADSRVRAWQFLESKMAEVEEKAEEKVLFSDEEGETLLGTRAAHWKLSAVFPEKDEAEENAQPAEKKPVEAHLSIRWQESGREAEEILAAYFLPYEAKEEE